MPSRTARRRAQTTGSEGFEKRIPVTALLQGRRLEGALSAKLVKVSRDGAATMHIRFRDKRLIEDLKSGEIAISLQDQAAVSTPAMSRVEHLGPDLAQPFDHRLANAADREPATPAYELFRPRDLAALFDWVKKLWNPARELQRPLDNILRRMMMCDDLVVHVHHRYDDKHYHEEFLRVFGQLHTQPLHCKRLFFYDSQEDSLDSQEGFLGAVVLHPYPLFEDDQAYAQIGYALLTPKIGTLSLPSTTSYHCAATNCTAYVEGPKRVVRCFPYMVQDGISSRCAHIAVHLASRYLHQHLNMAELSLDEIRHVGMPYDHVPLPVGGLSAATVMTTIDRMGCIPVAYASRRFLDRNRRDVFDTIDRQVTAGFREAVEILHAYLDSQLPVILAVYDDRKYRPNERHALVAIGHTVDRRMNPSFDPRYSPVPELPGYYTSSAYIRHVVVHDDSIGPYLLLPVSESQEFQGGTDADYNAEWSLSVEGGMEEMFVPLPPGVHLRAEHVYAILARTLPSMVGLYVRHTPAFNKALAGALKDGTVVVDLYLELGKRFLSNVFAERVLTDDGTAAILRELDIPRYVWVVELSTPHDRQKALSNRQKVRGFILYDATAPLGVRAPLVAWKLPGLLAWTDRDQGQKHIYKFMKSSSEQYFLLLYRNFEETGFNWNCEPRGVRKWRPWH